MPKAAVPERLPLGDILTGVVIEVGERRALALQPQNDAQTVYEGGITIRYGIRFMGKPHLSIVPGLVAVDYGQMLNGEAAWEFLFRRSNLYPRAEVFGYRSDGRDEMMYVKTLDLTQPIDVLAYTTPEAATPIAHLSALIAEEAEAAALPVHLQSYLPRYASLSLWLAETSA